MTERPVSPPSESGPTLEPGNETSENANLSGYAEADSNVLQPLYPGVQHAVDDLKGITEEYEAAGDIRRTAAGEPILNWDVVSKWAKQEAFGVGKRGTYHNADTYAYVKPCNLVPKEEDVDQTLATARYLTSRGAIHPESRWGVVETEHGYQLLVVSPKLEPYSSNENLSGAYENRPSRPMPDLSHLFDWYQRIDPNFVPGQPIPENSLLYHLNWHEASHHDNWGWDKTGALFPVDVEVLRPQEPTHKNPEPWKPIEPHVTDYLYL